MNFEENHVDATVYATTPTVTGRDLKKVKAGSAKYSEVCLGLSQINRTQKIFARSFS